MPHLEKENSKILSTVLITLFGLLGSIVIGFVFFGSNIFVPKNYAFQFVTNGFFGSFFFSLLIYHTKREQVFGIVFLFLLDFTLLLGKAVSLIPYLIRDILYLSALLLSIFLYSKYLKKNPQLKFYLRSFSLVLIYGALNTIFGAMVYLINAEFIFPPFNFLLLLIEIGVLIGLGIGLGCDLYLQNKERILELLNLKASQKK